MYEFLQHEEKTTRKLLSEYKTERFKMYGIYGLVTGFAIGVLASAIWKSSTFRSTKAVARSLKNLSRGYKMVLVVRTDLGMGKGKIAAQCSHAALGCYKIAQKTSPDVVEEWEAVGQPKIVLKLDTVGEDGLYRLMEESRMKGIASTVIRDAGHTQVDRGTATVAALGPHSAHTLDQITGHLKLL